MRAGLDKDEPRDRQAILRLALKACDIGHATRKWDLHFKWSSLITEEFYRQGDRERQMGVDASPLMDRTTGNLPKSQLGFFQFLATPLYKAYADVFPVMGKVMMDNIDDNVRRWTEM